MEYWDHWCSAWLKNNTVHGTCPPLPLTPYHYLSEAMQPWLYFSYMEAKNLFKKQQDLAVAGELDTEKRFADILKEGQIQGDFELHDVRLTASVINAMLQDWYLKRSKYSKRRISADQYAQFVLQFVEAFISKQYFPIFKYEYIALNVL